MKNNIDYNNRLFLFDKCFNIVKQDLCLSGLILPRNVSSQVAFGDECFTDRKLKERHINKLKQAGLFEVV